MKVLFAYNHKFTETNVTKVSDKYKLDEANGIYASDVEADNGRYIAAAEVVEKEQAELVVEGAVEVEVTDLPDRCSNQRMMPSMS